MVVGIRLHHHITHGPTRKRRFLIIKSKRYLKRRCQLPKKDWYLKLDKHYRLTVHPTNHQYISHLSKWSTKKACHLLVELEHKDYWVLRFLNFDQNQIGEKRKAQLYELDEIRLQVYESSKLYKERIKKYHDKKSLTETSNPGKWCCCSIK